MSVDRGAAIAFKVDSVAAFRIDVYRLGWYGGSGSRLVATVPAAQTVAQTQPACAVSTDASGSIDCGNWAVSATWTVPAAEISGLYVAKLVRIDTAGASIIPFVVRDDARRADVLLSTSDANWQAYNDFGGNSLYTCTLDCPAGSPAAYKGASKVSYNRPWRTAEAFGGAPWFEHAELSMLRFLEEGGYDVAYTTSVDVQSRGALLRNHRTFISSGQDEYWSAGQRANVEAARDAGVSLAFFSGNEIYWKTTWEHGNRTIVSYKETHYDADVNPAADWTGTWQDPRFSPPPGDGGRPQNALSGQVFSVNRGPASSSTSDIRVPAAYRPLRLWRNTIPAGGDLTLGQSTLGFEWDEDYDNGFRPAGSIRLSSTTLQNVDVFTDYGNSSAFGPATHNLTMYRAPSGALVFGAGTVQWSWGLGVDNPGAGPVDQNMRQATVNLLADMGAQPATRPVELLAAARSTDATAPTSTVSSPPATVADGATVTLSGSAADAGGGVVAGVEVSTDNGVTWRRAEGTTSWTYDWTAHGNPAVIRTRATDDSANTETPGPGRRVLVTCPCSIWGTNVEPGAGGDVDDAQPVELGLRFVSDAAGSVTGVRFFKALASTGPHTGSLWRADGQRLAQATFAEQPGRGWQTASFATPVPIQAGTPYVISYHAPGGHYAATRGGLYPPPAPDPRGGATADSPPLHAPRTTGAGATTTNGVYTYSAQSTFPTASFGASNYWVDPIFEIAAPAAPTGVGAAADGADGATVTWAAPAGGAAAVYEVTPRIGGVAQAATLVTGSPPATSVRIGELTTGSSYTFTVRAFNGGGSGPPSVPSNSVTPLAAAVPDPSGAGGIAGGLDGGALTGDAAQVPLAGGPGRAANRVRATLQGARVVRGSDNRARLLRVTVRVDEAVTLGTRLTRGARTLKLIAPARRWLRRGRHTINVALARAVAPGRAQLRLTFTDGAGATKTIRRTLAVPPLRRAR